MRYPTFQSPPHAVVPTRQCDRLMTLKQKTKEDVHLQLAFLKKNKKQTKEKIRVPKISTSSLFHWFEWTGGLKQS